MSLKATVAPLGLSAKLEAGRLVARLTNATELPSMLRTGVVEGPLAAVLVAPSWWLTRVLLPVVRSNSKMLRTPAVLFWPWIRLLAVLEYATDVPSPLTTG